MRAGTLAFRERRSQRWELRPQDRVVSVLDRMSSHSPSEPPTSRRRPHLALATLALAAGGLSLPFGGMRAELAGWSIAVPVDSPYLEDEQQIRTGGARQLYRRGVQELRAHRARDAYRDFTAVNEIVPGFRNVEQRI